MRASSNKRAAPKPSRARPLSCPTRTRAGARRIGVTPVLADRGHVRTSAFRATYARVVMSSRAISRAYRSVSLSIGKKHSMRISCSVMSCGVSGRGDRGEEVEGPIFGAYREHTGDSAPDAFFELRDAVFDAREALDPERALLGRERDQPVEPLRKRFARHSNFVSKNVEPLTLQDEDVRDVNDRPFESVEPGHGVLGVCHE